MDLKPPESVAKIAASALAMRDELPPSRRGGTPVGVKRASQLAGRQQLSPKTIKRMVSFFARHEVDKEAEGFHKGEEGFPSKGRQAWDLWGGDEGRAWANKMLAAIEREQGVTEMIDINVLTGADIRRIDGKYGKISKLSLPWVTVRWSDGKTESFLRSDEALSEDIELKTLDKGWIALGSVVGVVQESDESETEVADEADALPQTLEAAQRELRALRLEARIGPMKARLVEAAKKKKASKKVKAASAGISFKKGGEAPKSKDTVKKAQAAKAAGKAPKKKLSDKAKKAVGKKKAGGGKGGGGAATNPFKHSGGSYKQLGTNTKAVLGKNVKRKKQNRWSCTGDEDLQVCTALKDIPEQGIKKGDKKNIRKWSKKAQYTSKYEKDRASGDSKTPNNKHKPVAHSKFMPSGAISDAERDEIFKSSQSKKKKKAKK